MDAVVLLCDSTICRLCGEENDNGTGLFPEELDKENLSELINKYLPIKVEKDGKFPCTLCPGCTIQLEATRSFFDLIVEGQNKLRLLFANQQDVLRRREKQKEELKNALKTANPNSSIIAVHTADGDGDKIFIQVVTDGPLFPPEHELALRVEGLERPRKKRGRPPKPVQVPEEAAPVVEEARDEESDTEVDGKRKRKIKKPLRYQELLQGKELDRAFKEEGVLDDEESYSDNDVSTTDVKSTDDGAQEDDMVIGHMQDRNGEDLGQLVVSSKGGGGKLRTKHKGGDDGKRKEKYECEFCGRTFMHLGRLEIHRSFHKNIKYLCGGDDCLLNFDTKTSLEEHQKEAGHSGSKLIECLENYGQVELPQNSTEFVDVTPAAAVEPKRPDASPKTTDAKITCDLCQKTFSCRQNYEVHLKAVHENQKPYACDRCGKKFPYHNSLKIHMLQHNEKNYPCDSCKKIFNHPSSLLYHKEAEHNNGRKFVCNKCKKTFKHKQLLLRHQLVHTNERPHTCKSCDASFKTRANLLNHMPTHTGEKKYYCPQCGQTFAHKTSLTLHIRWHNGQKPYECDVCMKTFSQKGNLAEHRRIHTGEKPYCCNYCERRFTTSSQFKLHVKRHTGEKPWKCEYCSKTFLHKDTWKCHTRRHRNERPYQCQQCLRGFIEQWALRKHERLHTGEKPYVCDVCNKSFADSSNLTKHKKIHWNQKIKEEEKDPARGNINIVNVPNASDNQDNNRILYLTYQDTNSQNAQPETLVHIVDTMDANADGAGDKIEETLFGDDNMLPDENGEEVSLDIQLQQLVDNDGNAISLTTVDGQQIKVVSTMTDDEQCIQGLLPDGTLVPINLMMQDGKTDASTKSGNPASPKEDSELQDSQDLLQETIRMFADESKVQFGGKTNETNKFQVFADDGQNVFLMPYDMDGSIPNSFMDMQ